MPCRHALAVVVVSLATIFVSASVVLASAPIEVTTCGQQVPHGVSAYLSADLTCPFETNAVAIRLGGGATLDLQGHTVTGGIAAIACGDVLCFGDLCGPTRKSGKCEIANGTITGAHYEAVSGGKVVLRNMMLVDNRIYGVLAWHHVEIYDSRVEGTPNGVQAERWIRAVGTAFDAAPLHTARKIELDASSVTNGNSFGIQGGKIRLRNGSSVIGNVNNPQCLEPNVACADLMADRAPWLDGSSSCGTSVRTKKVAGNFPLPSWGVCTND